MRTFYKAKTPTGLKDPKPIKSVDPLYTFMYGPVEDTSIKLEDGEQIKITNFKIKALRKRDYEPGIRVKCDNATSCQHCAACPYKTYQYLSLPLDLVVLTTNLRGYLTKVIKDYIIKDTCKPYVSYQFIKQRSGTIVEFISETKGIRYFVLLLKKYSKEELKSMFLNKVFSCIFTYHEFNGNYLFSSREDLIKEKYKAAPEVYEIKLKDIVKEGKVLKYLSKNYRYTKRDLVRLTSKSRAGEIIDALKAHGFLRINNGLLFRTRKLLYILMSLIRHLKKVTSEFINDITELLVNVSAVKYYRFLLDP